WDGEVKLTLNNNKVKVFTQAIGGDPLTFDGTDNVFVNCIDPVELYVQGDVGSATMRDVEITATPVIGNTPMGTPDTVKFTVLWVDVSLNFGTASGDNSRKELVRGMSLTNDYNLGLRQYKDDVKDFMGGYFEGVGVITAEQFKHPSVDLLYLRASN